MANKGIIPNPRLQIKLSPKLCWYILTYLKDETDIPEGIRAVLFNISSRGSSKRNLQVDEEFEKLASHVSHGDIDIDDTTKISDTKSSFRDSQLQDSIESDNISSIHEAVDQPDAGEASHTKTYSSDTLHQDLMITSKRQDHHRRSAVEDVTTPTYPEDLTLSLEDLRWIYNHIRTSESEGIYFHEFFEGCEIILPKNPIVARNQVLEERCRRLRGIFESKTYDEMTKKVDCCRHSQSDDTFASQVKEMDKQVVAVLQLILSVVAGFAFGFVGVEFAFGETHLEVKLLLGIACALVVAVADFYFLVKKLSVEECERGYMSQRNITEDLAWTD